MPYHYPEYLAFVQAMRLDPEERTLPLILADWLEEHDKIDHARFVRGCVKVAEWRAAPTMTNFVLEMDAVESLRELINRHCHEWTAGAIRKFDNPTIYDWPNGFLRTFRCHWTKEKRVKFLFARQPIQRAYITGCSPDAFPAYGNWLRKECPGLEVRPER